MSQSKETTKGHNMGDDNKFYDLIDAERKERRQDIADIHSRIDQILDAINKLGKNDGSDASWVRQSVGLTIAVFSIVSIMTAIIIGMLSPVNLNLRYISENLDKAEIRCEKRVKKLDEKSILENERNKARLDKLEEWSNWWHKSLLIRDIKEHGRLIE